MARGRRHPVKHGDTGTGRAVVDDAHLALGAVDTATIGIIVTDAHWRVRLVSPGAERMLGLDPEEVVGRDIGAVGHPSMADTYAEGVRQMAARGGHREFPFKRRDGTVIPLGVTWSVIEDDDAVLGYSAVGRDITQRRELEEALRESARQFEEIAEAVPAGIYRMRLKPEPAYEYVNPAMEESLGVSAEAFYDDVDLPLRRIRPEDRERTRRSREDPTVFGDFREVRWRRDDGEHVWLEVKEVPIRDVSGEIEEVIGVVHDVSLAKRQQRALQQALRQEHTVADELRRLDRMRRTFLQAVSHELRTPLTSLLGLAATLRDRREELSEERTADLLDRLTRNAKRLGGLLEDLLDVDRLSQGVVELERRTVDLDEVLRRGLADAPVDSSLVRLDLTPVRGRVDPAKIERIVENLVVNATKHGGGVTEIVVRLRREGEQAVLTVADDGRGVPDGFKDRIFDPFEQGPEVGDTASPGTGVGLALVAEFARLHDGEVTVADRDGGGAVFEVRLPLR